jgi:hypothetical protein
MDWTVPTPPSLPLMPGLKELVEHYTRMAEKCWEPKERKWLTRSFTWKGDGSFQPPQLRLLSKIAIIKQRYIAYFVRHAISSKFKLGIFKPSHYAPTMTVNWSNDLVDILKSDNVIKKWVKQLIFTDKLGLLAKSQLVCSIPDDVRTEAEAFFRSELKKRCLEAWERKIKPHYPRPHQNKRGFQPSCLRFLAAQKIKQQIFMAARAQFVIAINYCYHVNVKLAIEMKDFALSYSCYDREDRICKMNTKQVLDLVVRFCKKGHLGAFASHLETS